MFAPKISTLIEKLTPQTPTVNSETREPATEGQTLAQESGAQSDTASLDDLKFETVDSPQPQSTPPPLPAENAASTTLANLREDAKFWSELGTRLWRAERQLHRLIESQSEAGAGLERMARRFEEIMETLEEYDIEILDHTGEKYDAGLSLKVLQFEPQNGISHEVITETVKPSLRLKGVLVSGEVIVATPREEPEPLNESEPSEESHEASTPESESALENSTIEDHTPTPENHEPQHH